MSEPREWRVEAGKFVLPGGNTMVASCHHRKKDACGGCYARLYVALQDIMESEDPKGVVRTLSARMKDEGTQKKARAP